MCAPPASGTPRDLRRPRLSVCTPTPASLPVAEVWDAHRPLILLSRPACRRPPPPAAQGGPRVPDRCCIGQLRPYVPPPHPRPHPAGARRSMPAALWPSPGVGECARRAQPAAHCEPQALGRGARQPGAHRASIPCCAAAAAGGPAAVCAANAHSIRPTAASHDHFTGTNHRVTWSHRHRRRGPMVRRQGRVCALLIPHAACAERPSAQARDRRRGWEHWQRRIEERSDVRPPAVVRRPRAVCHGQFLISAAPPTAEITFRGAACVTCALLHVSTRAPGGPAPAQRPSTWLPRAP